MATNSSCSGLDLQNLPVSELAAVPQETAHPSENKEKSLGLFSESSQKNQHHSFKILLPLPLAFLSQLHLQHLVKII